ncbi:MAG: hypothetical protein IJX47_03180 [Clostridia bacterium]|nr:hypothetical protein [Clostridia bacterium]
MRLSAYPTIFRRVTAVYEDLLEEHRFCLDDVTYDILRKRLVEGMSEVEIAMGYHYSREAVNRRLRSGLAKIEERIKN